MSTDNNVEVLLKNHEARTIIALYELQRKLILAMEQRDTLGDIHQFGKIVKQYKQTNKSSNETLALLSGVTSNTISTMTSDPTNSKVSTVLALLDAMGMTLTISRKSTDE